jgi:hypothetical protein
MDLKTLLTEIDGQVEIFNLTAEPKQLAKPGAAPQNAP